MPPHTHQAVRQKRIPVPDVGTCISEHCACGASRVKTVRSSGESAWSRWKKIRAGRIKR